MGLSGEVEIYLLKIVLLLVLLFVNYHIVILLLRRWVSFNSIDYIELNRSQNYEKIIESFSSSKCSHFVWLIWVSIG